MKIGYFFLLASLMQVSRALSHYNLLLKVDNKKSVNFFNFFDDVSTFALLAFMFYLIPLKPKKYPKFEKNVKIINLLLYLTYLFSAIFIVGLKLGYSK